MEELQQEVNARSELQSQLSSQAALVEHLQVEVGALAAQKEQLLADLAQLADAASMVSLLSWIVQELACRACKHEGA